MSVTDTTIIYLYSYVPALLLGGFFWWMDRFERESLFLVILVFLWGAFGAGLLSYFWNTFFLVVLDVYHRNSFEVNDMIVAVLVAPFVEELTKGAVILLLLKLNKVGNVTDGILMGVIVGLGFAASENVHYATEVVYKSSGELAMWYNLWFREIHTTLLHASASAVWGALIGYSRYHAGFQRYFTLFNGFILSMVTHGFWNFLASYVGLIEAETNLLEIVMRGELFLIFGMLLALFLFSVRSQSKIIVRELLDEHVKGIIPKSHIGFFASMVRHPKRYALPKGVSPKDYAQTGVRLAFRKYEYHLNPTEKGKNEIEGLREKLAQMAQFRPDSLQLYY